MFCLLTPWSEHRSSPVFVQQGLLTKIVCRSLEGHDEFRQRLARWVLMGSMQTFLPIHARSICFVTLCLFLVGSTLLIWKLAHTHISPKWPSRISKVQISSCESEFFSLLLPSLNSGCRGRSGPSRTVAAAQITQLQPGRASCCSKERRGGAVKLG